MGVGDDDTSSPLMCPPHAEVVLGDGWGGRPPGAIYVYTVGILGREEVLEFQHPGCGRGRRPHRLVRDDRDDGAPVTRRVLVKEDPTEPSGAEVGRRQGGYVARCSEGLSVDRYATEAAAATVSDPFLHNDLGGLGGGTLWWLAELKGTAMRGTGALEDLELAGLVGGVKSGMAWCLGNREPRGEGREESCGSH